MSRTATMGAGNATALAASSRYAAPPLRSGPSGDPASAAANGLATTGRVLPVVTGPAFSNHRRGRLDDAVDILGFCRQVPFIEGSTSIGVHLNSALGLSNEPGPPQASPSVPSAAPTSHLM